MGPKDMLDIDSLAQRQIIISKTLLSKTRILLNSSIYYNWARRRCLLERRTICTIIRATTMSCATGETSQNQLKLMFGALKHNNNILLSSKLYNQTKHSLEIHSTFAP